MTMLKTTEEIAQANGQPEGAPAQAPTPVATPTPIPVLVTAAHVPNAGDVNALVEAAHEHIEKLVNAELAQIQTTLAAAWRAAEASLAKSQAEVAALTQAYNVLEAKYHAAERKVAVLEEVRASLQKL
jgi:hypothetical protein